MNRLNGKLAMGYNALWNFGAPKYAGQPSAHVTMLPRHQDEKFSKVSFPVFVQRKVGSSTLGWEYCGEYAELEDDIAGITTAASVGRECKAFVLSDIKHSLSRPGGKWHGIIARYREKIIDLCIFKPNDRATLSAKDLGLNDFPKPKLTQVEFAEKLVEWDDFYESHQIVFKHYDNTVYDFVKDGKTTKNKYNKRRKVGEPCAKASDWYAIHDQQVESYKKETKKKRKRT